MKTDFEGCANVIIDKECIDCILSEPKNGENKFVTTLII